MTSLKKAEQEAINKIKPGVKISDIDKTARQIISDAGYGEYFPHRLGHGLGLEAHEYQDISETNDNVLEEGMVITIEPGIYVPGIVGVRIEDDILVTKKWLSIFIFISEITPPSDTLRCSCEVQMAFISM